MFNTQTKVLLPQWLMDKKKEVDEIIFLSHVQKYLTKYPNYKLLYVENKMAVCERK